MSETPRDLAPASIARRRRLARRRRRIQRLGVPAAVVTLVPLLVAVIAGGGSRVAHGSREFSAGRLATSMRRPKPPPVLLPRGGRTILPGRLVVAYYGIPGTSNILGQTSDPEADAAGVEQRARAYAQFGRGVQPAFELVTTIASPYPGPDGSYSSPIDHATLARYLRSAHRHKLLLILDFQPGRSEFLPQVRRYARYLLDPAVGVALDPEWKLAADQVPDQVIGSASASSINAVSRFLSRLVLTHRLPQKLFIVHEFRTTELPDRGFVAIEPGLATVLQMDGLGPVSTKLDSYRQVMTRAARFHPGFKIFLRAVDDPVQLTPDQVMALRPRPEYISYQ